MKVQSLIKLIVVASMLSLSVFVPSSGVHALWANFGIVNRYTGMCLTVLPEYKNINGAPVIQAPCEYPLRDHQLWRISSIDGYSRLYRVISELDGKCLDVPFESKSYNGTKLQLWDCYGPRQWNQLWYWSDVDRSVSGFWYFINRATHKCLDVPLEQHRKSGARIQQWDCYGVGQLNQHWGPAVH
jgi:hypothetical protein